MFRDLPKEIIKSIIANLDPVSYLRLSQTSTSFFNNRDESKYWFQKIIHEFNIPIEYLLMQQNHFAQYKIKVIDLYKNLLMLKKNQKILRDHLKYSYEDEDNYSYLLACCSDNIDYFCSIVPYEEQFLWAEISLYAGCDQLIHFSFSSSTLFNLSSDEMIHIEKIQKQYLDLIARSGRNDLLITLLKQENFTAKPDIHTLLNAVTSGSIAIVQYLLNPKNLFALEANSASKEGQTSLELAAYYGHLELVKLLFTKGAKISKTVLFSGINSRYLPIVKFLIENQKNKTTCENIDSLIQNSFATCDLSIYKELMLDLNLSTTELEEAGTTIKISFLRKVIEYQQLFFKNNANDLLNNPPHLETFLGISGNITILKSFADKGFIPGQLCLTHAVKSGHFKLVKYLVEELKINPDHEMLFLAETEGDNLSLVKYFLGKDKFSLLIDPEKIDYGRSPVISYYSKSAFMCDYAVFSSETGNLSLEEIENYFLTSFYFAPSYHLTYIQMLFTIDNYAQLTGRTHQILHNHITALSKINLNDKFPVQYAKIYAEKITAQCQCVNEVDQRKTFKP